jgi:hypothetical protein
MTEMLRESARLVGIPMFDHIIIGTVDDDPNGKGFFSFDEAR